MPRFYLDGGQKLMGCGCGRSHGHSRVGVEHGGEHKQGPSPTSFAPNGTKLHYAPDLQLEPVHTKLELDFDISNRTLAATVIVTIRNNRPASSPLPGAVSASGGHAAAVVNPKRESLVFNARGFKDLQIKSVDVPSESGETKNASATLVPVTFTYDSVTATVEWAKPFATPNETRAIAFTYRIVKPISGLLFGVDAGVFQDTLSAGAGNALTKDVQLEIPSELTSTSTSTSSSAAAQTLGVTQEVWQTVDPSVRTALAALATARESAASKSPLHASAAHQMEAKGEVPAGWVVSDHETERAQYWVPCLDAPAARTSLDYFITAPEHLTIIANGVLKMETTNAGKKTAHWRLDFPCPAYLMCLAVGRFHSHDAGDFQGIPIKYFGSPTQNDDGPTPERLALSLKHTPSMLEWMTKLLRTPFPFPKYYQFVGGLGVGGAMENISLVTWSQSLLLDTKGMEDMAIYTAMVNVHEMAHSYFGDAVVCRHFDHAWLKEGWATFMEYMWLRDNVSVDECQYYMGVEGASYMSETETYSRPLVTNQYVHSWNMYDYHLYPGGAWRLHMLMNILGRGVFYQGVAAYLQANIGKTVETHTFREALEKAAGGINLTQFFDQWVHGVGFPVVKAVVETNTPSLFSIRLSQTQKLDENGTRAGHAFAFTLDVAIQTASGKWSITQVDFKQDKSVATASFAIAEPVVQVVIDPDHKVLMKLDFNPGLPMLAKTLSTYDSPYVNAWTRSLAAKSLAQASSSDDHVAVLEAACEKEPYWGTRARIAHALAKQDTVASIRALTRLMLRESNGSALLTFANVLGNCTPNTAARDAILNLLTRGVPLEKLHKSTSTSSTSSSSLLKTVTTKDSRTVSAIHVANVLQAADAASVLPYRAHAALLAALGKHANVLDVPYLVVEVLRPSYNGIVQNGAVQALADLVDGDVIAHDGGLTAQSQLLAQAAVRAVINVLVSPHAVTPWQLSSYAGHRLRIRAASLLGSMHGKLAGANYNHLRQMIESGLTEALSQERDDQDVLAALIRALTTCKTASALDVASKALSRLSYQELPGAKKVVESAKEALKKAGEKGTFSGEIGKIASRVKKLEESSSKASKANAANATANANADSANTAPANASTAASWRAATLVDKLVISSVATLAVFGAYSLAKLATKK